MFAHAAALAAGAAADAAAGAALAGAATAPGAAAAAPCGGGGDGVRDAAYGSPLAFSELTKAQHAVVLAAGYTAAVFKDANTVCGSST